MGEVKERIGHFSASLAAAGRERGTCCFRNLCSGLCVPAVLGPHVRRRPRGGERRAGAEPQSGDRREAAELHLAAHLAARDQPHELPAHGKHSHNHSGLFDLSQFSPFLRIFFLELSFFLDFCLFLKFLSI